MYFLSKEDVLECMFCKWYQNFQQLTIKSCIIDLPSEFINYLLDDGPLVLPPGLENNIHVTQNSTSNSTDSWNEGNSDLSQLKAPEFSEVIKNIGNILINYKSVFPKLNWSAPKDAVWISPCNSLRCTSAGEIILLLKSSQFIVYDLTSPFKLCENRSSDVCGDPELSYQLILRKWAKLSEGMEFRCFVKENALKAISQRYYKQHFEHIPKEKHNLSKQIQEFLNEKVINIFPLTHYVVDIYKKRNGEFWIIDFNPWGTMTDSLLFTWDELNSGLLADTTHDCSLIDQDGKCIGKFRYAGAESTMQPSDMLSYRMPQDFVDLSTGEDATKLIDFLQMKTQNNLSLSSDSEDDESWRIPT